MKLTEAQARMIARAKQLDVEDGLYKLLVRKYPEALNHKITQLHGGGDFRVAYKLRDLGLGRLVCYAPIDAYFFKLEG